MSKKSLFLKGLLCLMSIAAAGNLNPASAEEWDVSKIRIRYNEIKSRISRETDEFMINNKSTITLEHMLPGPGPQEMKYELFFTPYGSTPDGNLTEHRLELVQASYTTAGQDTYEEYLFDEDGQILFILACRMDTEIGGWIKSRWYFNGPRILKESITQTVEDTTFDLPASSNPAYYFPDLLWKSANIYDTAQLLFSSANPDYKVSRRYQDMQSYTSEDMLALIPNMILSLPGAEKYSVFMDGEPTPEEPYYGYRLGENMEDHFTTLYRFRVYIYPDETAGGNKIARGYCYIKIYDIISDTEIPLDEWLEKHGTL